MGSSNKYFLEMITYMDQTLNPHNRWNRLLLLWEFRLLVGVHLLIIAMNVIALILLPFLTPFYIATPICSLLVNFMFNRNMTCPLTDLENVLRRKLLLPEIRGFVGHYIIKPIRISLKGKKEAV